MPRNLVIAAATIAGGLDSIHGVGLDSCNPDWNGACFGNGECSRSTGRCVCDPGWKGTSCDILDEKPVNPAEKGYHNASSPVWGGTVVKHGGKWHLFTSGKNIVGSSRLQGPGTHAVRAVSTKGPAGPYTYASDIAAVDPARLGAGGIGLRTDVHRAPNGSLVLFTAGALDGKYGVLSLVSPDGSPEGPWLPNLLYRNQIKDSARWDCGQVADPSASIAPDGSVLVMYRTEWNCAGEPLERIGLLHSPNWATPMSLTHVTSDSGPPLFGFNVSNEDPFIWRSSRGVHALFHTQGDDQQKLWPDRKSRGAVAFCPGDGLNVAAWRISSNAAFNSEVRWTNGSTSEALRRQRPAVILDDNGELTHLITGANFENSDWHFTNANWALVTPLLSQEEIQV